MCSVPLPESLQGIDCLKFNMNSIAVISRFYTYLSDQTMVRVSIHLHTELEYSRLGRSHLGLRQQVGPREVFRHRIPWVAPLFTLATWPVGHGWQSESEIW